MKPRKKRKISVNQRKHMRFPPPSGTVARLQTRDGSAGSVALLLDESYTGCSLVMIGPAPFTVSQTVALQGETIPHAQAEIRWLREIDTKVIKIGLTYL